MNEDAATAERRRLELVRLLGRVGDGDRSALKTVYDRTGAKLFGICLRILRDREEAEDVLQDVYVAVWAKAVEFDSTRASPITWLSTIARNRAIDRARQIGRRVPGGDLDEAAEIADPGVDALARLEHDDEARRLAACLSELEERTAGAIRSAFFDGHTYSELAERLELPLSTMKSQIRRALTKLKGCLGR